MHFTSFIPATIFFAFTIAQDLVSVLKSQPDLSTLLGALEKIPDVTTSVASASNITVLAPTNDAFACIPPDSAIGKALAAGDKDAITALISYHVLNGTYKSTDFSTTPTFVPTLLAPTPGVANVTGGQNIELVLNGTNAEIISGNLAVSMVTQADILVGGITIHKISQVLTLPLPISSQASASGLTSAVSALTKASLATTIDKVSDLTLFVPTNEAFKVVNPDIDIATLTKVLTYHAVVGKVLFSTALSNTSVVSKLEGNQLNVVVSDMGVMINDAKVVVADVIVANGVVHVIDKVLMPKAAGCGGMRKKGRFMRV